jgi:hypothetical protein
MLMPQLHITPPDLGRMRDDIALNYEGIATANV